MQPIPNILVGVYGDIKTGKSSVALTFPKPMVYLDFDHGFHRAAWRYPQYRTIDVNSLGTMHQAFASAVPETDVYLRSYHLPLVFPGQKTSGYLQMYDEVLLPDMQAIYSHPGIKTVVIDTGSMLWKFVCETHLERLNQFKPRENLMPIDYRRPNLDMRTLIGIARQTGKNLCIVHHVGGVYESRIGSNGRAMDVQVGETWAGWKEMGATMDMVARCYNTQIDPAGGITKTPPYAVVEHSGLTLSMEGARIDEPTHERFVQAIQYFRGV